MTLGDASSRRDRPSIEMVFLDGTPTIRGELDLLSVPELEHFLVDLDGNCEVDLSGVTFFDSSALRTFLGVRRYNTRLRIVRPSKAVARVLEITDTLDYLVLGREIAW
jgi:anti-anti-sigma factor